MFGHWDLGAQGNVILDETNRAAREALSDQMMSYWANFAWTGDPGRGRLRDLPAWRAWDGRPDTHKYMILDTEAGGGLRMGSEPVTIESVLAAVDADPRLTTQRDRCFVYRELARWGGGFGEAAVRDGRPRGLRGVPVRRVPVGLSGFCQASTSMSPRRRRMRCSIAANTRSSITIPTTRITIISAISAGASDSSRAN